jgi:hypothetical protein
MARRTSRPDQAQLQITKAKFNEFTLRKIQVGSPFRNLASPAAFRFGKFYGDL